MVTNSNFSERVYAMTIASLNKKTEQGLRSVIWKPTKLARLSRTECLAVISRRRERSGEMSENSLETEEEDTDDDGGEFATLKVDGEEEEESIRMTSEVECRSAG